MFPGNHLSPLRAHVDRKINIEYMKSITPRGNMLLENTHLFLNKPLPRIRDNTLVIFTVQKVKNIGQRNILIQTIYSLTIIGSFTVTLSGINFNEMELTQCLVFLLVKRSPLNT